VRFDANPGKEFVAMTGATAAGGASAGGHRSVRAELARRLGTCLGAAGFYLEDVSVRRAGSRSVVQVVVDREGGVDLDAVAEANRLICAELDSRSGTDADAGLAGPYVLEVSSPGVDRPLTLPRHWRRATGRLVSVQTRDGRRILGRVREAAQDAVELDLAAAPAAGRRRKARPDAAGAAPGAPASTRVDYGEVARALVQVEFAVDDDEPDAATDLTPFEPGTDIGEEMGS
jgi:ribosome maturation factor RimP